MNRILIFTGIVIIVLSGCTQRTICPAYQSAFIHDKDALLAHFSYFQPDSTPKIRDVNKSRYLLIKPVAYQKRIREMNNIVMTDIYPVLVDSADMEDELMYAERDIVDSAAVGDGAEKIHPGLIGPFNTDQELYMYYLRDILVLPDERADMSTEASDQGQKKNRRKNRKNDDNAVEEEKEKKGPFSIFGKKKKKEEETTEEETPQESPTPNEEQNDEF